MVGPPPAKPELRLAMRARRAAFVADAAATAALTARLLAAIGDGPVAGYAPIGGEADPTDALAAVAQRGQTVALPRAGGDGVMAFHAWHPGEALERGRFGVLTPPDHAPVVTPATIIVPLLAFDRTGRRLGQGGGYYDRILAALPGALPIGCAWSWQELPRVPVDPWDRPLRIIVTEREEIAV